jgi:hypothetical protein
MKPKVPSNGYVLFDSERKSKTHPDAWDHPAKDVLDQIQPGYLVNVGVTHAKLAGERFWGIVREINGSSITIQIDQKLVCCKEHGLNYKDDVSIEMRHVFGIVNAQGKTVWPVDEESAT